MTSTNVPTANHPARLPDERKDLLPADLSLITYFELNATIPPPKRLHLLASLQFTNTRLSPQRIAPLLLPN